MDKLSVFLQRLERKLLPIEVVIIFLREHVLCSRNNKSDALMSCITCICRWNTLSSFHYMWFAGGLFGNALFYDVDMLLKHSQEFKIIVQFQ